MVQLCSILQDSIDKPKIAYLPYLLAYDIITSDNDILSEVIFLVKKDI